MLSEEGWAVAWQQRDVLLRIARKRVPTWEDAEDVVAEAIRRAGLSDGVPVEALPAWLTRVTVNLCIDRQRRLATERALVQRVELRPDPEPSHEERVANRAEAVWISQALRSLPARQAQVLSLRAEGVSSAGIADRLGLTVNAVEGLLKRARAVLRESLRAVGVALVALWVRPSRAHRPAGLVALTLAVTVTMLLLPWSTDPASPVPPGSQRAGAARSTSDVRGRPDADRPSTVVLPRSRSLLPVAGGSSRIGTGPAYDGPHCLAPYCLPVVDDGADMALGSERPRGWSPQDLHDYFAEPVWVPTAARRRPAVVIVSYGRFAWTAGDLDVYRRTFHLPRCTLVDRCLSVVDPADRDGEDTPFDRAEYVALGIGDQAEGRATGLKYGDLPSVEQAQMLEGVSAACPECRLVLVRAASQSEANMAAALRAATRLPAELVVTEMWSQGFPGTHMADRATYGRRLVLASGGDLGYTGTGGDAPRSLPFVVGVGGTGVLGGRVRAVPDTETFCNTRVRRPAWQATSDTGCPGRAGVDVSAPADGLVGLAMYDTGGLAGGRGWYHPGHNVQAAAIVAGMFARHHLAAVVHGPADLYAHPEWFADIVRGSTACSGAGSCKSYANTDSAGCLSGAPQLCYARRGWDGPTGLGEPRHLPWL